MAGLFVSSVGEKARGVYIAGDEVSCGNGASYFAYLTSGYTSLLSYLRDGSETNTATVRMNYCKPEENLSGPWQTDIDYYVTGSIVSTQNIANGFSVGYHAGSYVELNDGFVSGTDFIAEINRCVITKTEIAAKTDDLQEEQNSNNNNSQANVSIKIYPTVMASGNAINIETNEAILGASITLYDIQAKAIQYTNLPELNAHDKYSLLLGHLPSGLYFVRVQSNSISTTQKIIVK